VSDDLRCDCDEDARPVVKATERWPVEYFVLCDRCGYSSSTAMTREGAEKFWTTLDRIHDRDEATIGPFRKRCGE
jgi:hypothetical protein